MPKNIEKIPSFSLVGYCFGVPPELGVVEILLPGGWIESLSVFDGNYIPMDDLDESYVALPVGYATGLARGFDEPDERLRWYLRRRLV